METGVLISITIYMIGMLYIGYYSYKRTKNLNDYMLGGRDLGPLTTALSAGASDMSGWLVMGLPGAMFATGLSSGWIAVGLIIGALLNWVYVAPRLRVYTEIANDSITIPGYLENRFGEKAKVLRMVSGVVILVFFTFYVSSGMVSGGVLFESIFGMNYHTGLLIIAGVTIAYTLFGGFLAVSLTDLVQGLIMVIALILVPIVALIEINGLGTAIDTAREIDPALLDIFRGTSVLGIISFLAWGLGYFGQPHIIVRFMAIRSVKQVKSATWIGMLWMIFCIIGAMFIGFVGIGFFNNTAYTIDDPETVFILLGEILFHPLITGFIIAAILAAIMSTVSSQLLVTSSSLTEDIYNSFLRKSATDKELVLIGRISVMIISIIALWISWEKNSTILDLVGYAWAGFGSAFGPMILLSLFWKRMTSWGALAGMIFGTATVIIWSAVGLSDTLYEMVPGFFISLLAVIIFSLITSKPPKKVEEDFEEYKKALNQR
ncbi:MULTISPECIES: sodium/proline symporter PutP [Cytobacillus]|uniref:Sodium/proline symporter n=1 Tax=Cytobacillus stercorigallinarum TaxID=2762240 RepID=A0ABR8QVB7_9BACI|nr:sodium/proline symporter PutP [Cytobacillus stercorigallinarum]MBD7939484.1 sodium/proline symporter PutP [Cytobacillus stercorigallinarum]